MTSVIFGTRDIYVEEPLFPGQRPVYEEVSGGELLRWYSTGKLEQAIAAGCTTYVVSIRPAFGPHDEWWQALVPPDRVFVNAGMMAAFTGAPAMAKVFDAWRRFYARFGLRWSDAFSDLDDPRKTAVEKHGFIDGGVFSGHQSLN